MAAITGTETADILFGTAGDDIFSGLGGDDILNAMQVGGDSLPGGAGNDTLQGGDGDDIYFVDSASDVVVESSTSGFTDTVIAWQTSYTLPTNVEALILYSFPDPVDVNATGNSGKNLLVGNTGNNILDGGAEADWMIGLDGNDTYVVDDDGDTVVEDPGEGTDTVQASVDIMRLPDDVENLIIADAGGALIGRGNALANHITGNTSRNLIHGGAGDDTLDGGAGGDLLAGGKGNDVYVVDNAADLLFEYVGQGNDTIQSGIDFNLDNVGSFENLVLIGAAVNGTGDLAANGLTGDSIANSLNGMDGNDTLSGLAGADTLNGGNGNDSLTGGGNADRFVFDTALNASTNTDTILDFNPAQNDRIQLDNDVFLKMGLSDTTRALNPLWFSGDGVAHDSNDYIIYSPKFGTLTYDRNGSVDGGNPTVFAIVGATDHPVLASTDFQIIG